MSAIIIQIVNNLTFKKVSWNSIALLLLLLNLLPEDVVKISASLIEILKAHQKVLNKVLYTLLSIVKSLYLMELLICVDPLHFQYLKIMRLSYSLEF